MAVRKLVRSTYTLTVPNFMRVRAECIKRYEGEGGAVKPSRILNELIANNLEPIPEESDPVALDKLFHEDGRRITNESRKRKAKKKPIKLARTA